MFYDFFIKAIYVFLLKDGLLYSYLVLYIKFKYLINLSLKILFI